VKGPRDSLDIIGGLVVRVTGHDEDTGGHLVDDSDAPVDHSRQQGVEPETAPP